MKRASRYRHKHKFSWSEQVRFHYERFLSLQGAVIFLNLLGLFLIAFTLLYVLHCFLYRAVWDETIGDHHLTWHVFLEMLSPARISSLKEPPTDLLLLSVVTTFVGFGFYSLLIAYVSTKTLAALEVFRSGSGPVIESGHTLILGFDTRVRQLIRELNYSNLSRQKLPVVVISQSPKVEMDIKVSPEMSSCSRVRISTASGDPSRVQNLLRVNAIEARSAIILARCSYAASPALKADSDVRVIQTVKALYALQERRFPIVAEIFDRRRRELIDSLSDSIVTFDGKELLASILVQAAIYEGIDLVYNQLFSFDESEFYLYDKLPPGTCFGELMTSFADGVPVGVQTSTGEITIGPPDDYVIDSDEKLLMVAYDDKFIQYQRNPVCVAEPITQVSIAQPITAQNILVIGWHYLAPAILSECRLRLPDGSKVTVAIAEDLPDLERTLQSLHDEERVKFIRERRDPFRFKELERLDPFQYDTVILLSRGGQVESEDQMDADTLMLVMLLRKLRDKQIGRPLKSRIITQLFRPENEPLIDIGDPEHDDPVHHIFTSQISTMLFTQLSEDGNMAQLYQLLFTQCTHEIALCPIEDYTDRLTEVTFPELYMRARARDEICLGFWSTADIPELVKREGLWLNPPKTRRFTFTEEDQVVIFRLRRLGEQRKPE